MKTVKQQILDSLTWFYAKIKSLYVKKSDIVASTTITESGKLMDGKTCSDALAGHTHNYLVNKNANIINSTANDTSAKWGAQKNCVSMYNTLGCLNGQPNQYGLVANFTDGNTEVHQLWMSQANGYIYHRGGNSSALNGWRRLLESDAIVAETTTLAGKGYTWNQLPGKSGYALVACTFIHNDDSPFITQFNRRTNGSYTIWSNVAMATGTNYSLYCVWVKV